MMRARPATAPPRPSARLTQAAQSPLNKSPVIWPSDFDGGVSRREVIFETRAQQEGSRFEPQGQQAPQARGGGPDGGRA